MKAYNDVEAMKAAKLVAITVPMIVWQGNRYIGEVVPIGPQG